MKRVKSHWLRIMIPSFIRTVVVLAILSMGNSTVSFGQEEDFHKIIGGWIRMDGDYAIHVNDIMPNGSVDAAYFNPSPVNVSEANISNWKGLVKLFIKLQDEGYPGSTYNLYYYTEKDALAGFYYQAELQQTFEVVFLRKTTD